MAGNSFGEIFKITTFGESHGPAIGVIIDGVPPNIPIDINEIQKELARRKPGQSAITTQRKEGDSVEILSGVFEGKSTGTALAMLIRNKDQQSKDYLNIKDVFRPGHADYTFLEKYGIRDYRGSGRSSGRETASRVAAGAVAKVILAQHGVKITAYTLSVGDVAAKNIDLSVIEQNIVRAPDMEAADLMIKKIEEMKSQSDSIGGVIEAVVQGCPSGLGDPVFDKLNARLAYGLMSIGTLRGIEFGRGFGAARLKGSENNDPFTVKEGKVRTATNNAGGILGGISTGEAITLRVAVKPPSSIEKKQGTVTVDMKETTIEVKGRHDPCICPRVVPVVEAMIALTLVDSLLIQKTIRS